MSVQEHCCLHQSSTCLGQLHTPVRRIRAALPRRSSQPLHHSTIEFIPPQTCQSELATMVRRTSTGGRWIERLAPERGRHLFRKQPQYDELQRQQHPNNINTREHNNTGGTTSIRGNSTTAAEQYQYKGTQQQQPNNINTRNPLTTRRRSAARPIHTPLSRTPPSTKPSLPLPQLSTQFAAHAQPRALCRDMMKNLRPRPLPVTPTPAPTSAKDAPPESALLLPSSHAHAPTNPQIPIGPPQDQRCRTHQRQFRSTLHSPVSSLAQTQPTTKLHRTPCHC
jgi:hypothetical protein